MKKEIKVFLKKLDERAVIPTYAHYGDVGMDLTAIDVEYDADKDMYIYHTGLAFASDFNIGQYLFLRSSNCKTECYLCNHVGVIDCAIYRGELQLRMKLRDSIETMALVEMFKSGYGSYEEALIDMKNRAKNLEFAPYKAGDRVAQMVFLQYPTVNIEVVDKLNETIRGDGGFGSSGK